MNGSTVTIEIAPKVKCVVCHTERYAMTQPYVCHDCWKDGSVGMFIAELQGEVISLREANALKDQKIGAYQDRIEYLQRENARLTAQLEINQMVSIGQTDISQAALETYQRYLSGQDLLQGFGE
jgi:hypothetical protein